MATLAILFEWKHSKKNEPLSTEPNKIRCTDNTVVESNAHYRRPSKRISNRTSSSSARRSTVVIEWNHRYETANRRSSSARRSTVVIEWNQTKRNIESNIIFVGTKINRRYRMEPSIRTSHRRSSSARMSTSSLDRIKRNEHSAESKGSQTEDQQRDLVQEHRLGNEYGAEPKQANIEPNVETIDLNPTNTETLLVIPCPDAPDVNRVPLKRSTVGKFVTELFVFLFFLLCAWNTPLVFRENFCYAVKM